MESRSYHLAYDALSLELLLFVLPVLSRIHAAVGVVETVDEHHSVLVTGADSLETIAVWIGMLGLDFHITEPPELVEHVRTLGERYRRALP